jgi:hypothetical protein
MMATYRLWCFIERKDRLTSVTISNNKVVDELREEKVQQSLLECQADQARLVLVDTRLLSLSHWQPYLLSST